MVEILQKFWILNSNSKYNCQRNGHGLRSWTDFQSTRLQNFFLKLWKYEGNDEGFLDAHEKFGTYFVNQIVDMTIMSMESCFEQLWRHKKWFWYLYKFYQLKKKVYWTAVRI